jgi:hypothetical protein
MMNKRAIAALILLALALISCARQITEQEAKAIAVDFTNQRVRFTYPGNDTGAKDIVHTAQNAIVGAEKSGNTWQVSILTETIIGNETKNAYFTLVIDATSGNVTDVIQHKLNRTG